MKRLALRNTKTTKSRAGKIRERVVYVANKPIRGRFKIKHALGIGLLAFIGYKIGRNIYNNARKSSTEKKTDTDVAVQVAQTLSNAFNPSGRQWMRKVDGSNRAEIYRAAQMIGEQEELTLTEVAKVFKKMHQNKSLYDELKRELDTDEYRRFMQLAASVKTGSNLKTGDYVPLKWAYTKRPVYVRSYPERRGLKTWYVFENIIDYVRTGKVIGQTTGKQIFDTKHDVLYVEVMIVTDKKNTVKAYAWKGALEFLSKQEIKKRHFGRVPMFIFQQYNVD